MLTNYPVKILLKIISNGNCQNQNFQAILNQSNNLIRISYDEIYENEKVSTAFSILSDNSLRISKKGAYSYSLNLKQGETLPFNLNYGGYSVDYNCQTKSVKVSHIDEKIEIYAHYLLISGSEKTSNKIYLTILK